MPRDKPGRVAVLLPTFRSTATIRPVTEPAKTPAGQDAPRKACPFCAESIPFAANWCRFCKSDLVTGQTRESHHVARPRATSRQGVPESSRVERRRRGARLLVASAVAAFVVVTATAAAHAFSRPDGGGGGKIRGYDVTYVEQTTQQRYVRDQSGCGGVGYSEADCLNSSMSGQWVTVPGPAVTKHDIVCAHSLAEARELAPADATVTGKTVDANCAD